MLCTYFLRSQWWTYSRLSSLDRDILDREQSRKVAKNFIISFYFYLLKIKTNHWFEIRHRRHRIIGSFGLVFFFLVGICICLNLDLWLLCDFGSRPLWLACIFFLESNINFKQIHIPNSSHLVVKFYLLAHWLEGATHVHLCELVRPLTHFLQLSLIFGHLLQWRDDTTEGEKKCNR